MNEESWYVGGVLQETRDFRYDAMGNLTSVNSDEAVYAFAYDNLDRRTQTIRDYLTLTAMPSVTTNSVYDSNNRRTQLAATIGSTDDFVTDFAYDSLSRMTGIEQHGVTGGNAVANKRTDLAYNAAGQFDTITRYADLAATQSVATTDFLYDHTGRLSDLTHTQGATTLSGYSYSYDAANQVAEIDSLIDGVTTYTQDLTGQLTAADHASQSDESYAYDDNGNRTGIGTSTGDDNQLLSDGTYHYQYDPEGNRIQKTNIATGATTDYTWDHHNNLIEVTEKNASAVIIKTVQYGYDGFDHKIWKKVITSSGTQTEVYVYDGLRQEQSGTGDVMILRFDGSGDVTNRYLHGPAVDQILADEQVTNTTTPGDIFWPLTDHLGSVRDVAEYDAVTGITSIANHIVFDSFGNRTSETNAAVDSLFGFTGREWDSDVDLQYNRARWYDPNTGTWASNDPVGFAAGDANLYRYVGNQPTTAIDPSGLARIPINGEQYFVHEYDLDPKPSEPHYHIGNPNSPMKIDINTGEVYRNATPTNAFVGKKLLAKLRAHARKLGLMGTAITISCALAETAQAGQSGGFGSAAETGVGIGIEEVSTGAASIGVGGVLIAGTSAAGTSITVSGGVAATGIAGAGIVGGSAIAAGGVGYGIGYGIGSVQVGDQTIHEHLGDAIGGIMYGIGWY